MATTNPTTNKPNQKVIINNDDIGNQKFMKMFPNHKFITFGTNNADYTAKNIKFEGLGSSFEIYKDGTKLSEIGLSVPGKHNVYNALAVYSALNEAGINLKETEKYFYTFSGMGRRFQKVCDFDNIKVYDDYAHHPSEIKTTLSGAKSAKKQDEKIVAVFQPHRYTRLKSLWNEFKQAFNDADELIVTDVYSASEAPIPNITAKNFADEMNSSKCIYVSGSMEECAKKIYPLLKKNDILITLGAGNITQLGKLIEKEYQKAN